MCCLFGLIDYNNSLSCKEKNNIIRVLSKECEVRGTDASGIAYNANGGLHIYKRPLPAHKMRFRVPAEAKVIMGHTRMTTQGSEKFNYNNHPFYGEAGKTKFALAHNGVLHNDDALKVSEHLPSTKIQTDSYVAVQLIEKEKSLDFGSIKNMAEKTKGSFCYTILNDRNELYIVKGDNPMALYSIGGYYIYASTEVILQSALEKLGIPLEKCMKLSVKCGDILKISADGNTEVRHFEYDDPYENFYRFPNYPYGSRYKDYYDDYLEDLMECAGFFGADPQDVMLLAEVGYNTFEIEELLYEPEAMREILCEIK